MATNFDGVTIEKAPVGAIPRCPKCDKRLETIWIKKRWNFTTIKNVVMCPYCEVFLGYGMWN